MNKKIMAALLALFILVTQVIPALASGGYSAPYPGSGDNGEDESIPGGEVTIPGGEDESIQPVDPTGYTLFRDGEAPVRFVLCNDGTYRPVGNGGFFVSQYVGFENPLVLVRQNGDEKTVMLPFDTMESNLEVLDTDELREEPDGTITYRPAVGGSVTLFDTTVYDDERDAVSISLLYAYISDNSVLLWTDNVSAAAKLTAEIVIPFLQLARLEPPDVRVPIHLSKEDTAQNAQIKIIFPGNRVFGMKDSLRWELADQYGLWAFRLKSGSYIPLAWNKTGIGHNGIVVKFQNSFADCVDGEAAA